MLAVMTEKTAIDRSFSHGEHFSLPVSQMMMVRQGTSLLLCKNWQFTISPNETYAGTRAWLRLSADSPPAFRPHVPVAGPKAALKVGVDLPEWPGFPQGRERDWS